MAQASNISKGFLSIRHSSGIAIRCRYADVDYLFAYNSQGMKENTKYILGLGLSSVDMGTNMIIYVNERLSLWLCCGNVCGSRSHTLPSTVPISTEEGPRPEIYFVFLSYFYYYGQQLKSHHHNNLHNAQFNVATYENVSHGYHIRETGQQIRSS